MRAGYDGGCGNHATGSQRLTAIEIVNYRGFRGEFRLELPVGENLIVYGENGSGKSSLYNSIRTFLEAPELQVRVIERGSARWRAVAVTDGANRFTSDSPLIRLEFGATKFEWSSAKNDTLNEVVRKLNQGKGFLDYKALLDIHYVRQQDEEELDLFPLLIQRLLPYYTYPSPRGVVRFQSGWRSLNRGINRRWRSGDEAEFVRELETFNDALQLAVRDLGIRASEMLQTFGDDFAVEFALERAALKKDPKRLVGPRILIRPAFRKLQVNDYHDFFNEAKLNALAICVFFAALIDSPAKGLRMLVLDDVLIGLDMGNRAKVVELIHEHFSDWQIIILTYSKAWFESLKDRVKTLDWSSPWLSTIFWEAKGSDGSTRIVAEGSGDLLEMAERHLQRKDFTAAAVYARKALENCCHRTCAKASLKVLYVESAKDRQLQDFLDVLQPRIAEFREPSQRTRGTELMILLARAKAFVLNPNAHFDIEEEDVLSVEVETGLTTVREFIEFAESQSWKRSQFAPPLKISVRDEMRLKLSAARGHLLAGEIDKAQEMLRQAHRVFWDLYGSRIGVTLEMGTDVDPWKVWKAAIQQGKLPSLAATALMRARPYFSGKVVRANFEAAKFESAILTLERLSAPLPLPSNAT